MRELKERMSNRNQHKSEQEMEKYESEKGGRMRAAFFKNFVSLLSDLLCRIISLFPCLIWECFL